MLAFVGHTFNTFETGSKGIPTKSRMILFEKIIHDAIKWKNSLLVVLNVLIERVMFSIEKYDIREILVECYNVSLEFNTIEKAIRNDISI